MSEPARAYLDSNVFIEAFEQETARADHARWVLNAIEAGRIVAVTSELTLAEVLVRPIQANAPDLADAYEQMLTDGDGFAVIPVGRPILVEAARVRAGRSAIRLPDAIHLATARAARCPVVVSGDRRMATPDGPMIVALGPFTVEDVLGNTA